MFSTIQNGVTETRRRSLVQYIARYQIYTCSGCHVLTIMIKNSGRLSPLSYTVLQTGKTKHYFLVSLYLFCVWSHSAVMRKGRTNNSQEQFVCARRFCFARGSPPLKTTIVKFFAESDDVSYKDLIDALTKLLEYLQTFYNPRTSDKFG
jgi:hypothetical protein